LDIAVLDKLKVLDVSGCEVSDASPLCSMSKLTRLCLRNNPLMNVEELAKLWATRPNALLDCRGVNLAWPSWMPKGVYLT